VNSATSFLVLRLSTTSILRVCASCLVVLSLPLASCNQRRTTVPHRYLIVSSDDAGMCHGVNAATIDGLERGIVTSVSIMPTGPAYAEFAEYAVRHPEYDYGVHLTLTCDLPSQPWGPLSAGATVPSLIDEQGNFWATNNLVAQHAKIEEVEAELRSQIDQALESGIRVTHLDHHMFVLYSRIDLLELYIQLALDYGLPIRIVGEPGKSALIPTHDEQWMAAYRNALERLDAAGLPVLGATEFDNYQQRRADKRLYHIRTLRGLQPGVTELIVHCAYSVPDSAEPPDVESREADTRFVVSEEAHVELRRLRIRRIGWEQFRRLHSPTTRRLRLAPSHRASGNPEPRETLSLGRRGDVDVRE
jgi:predicted glycoside hydrolase/deacetylase ChbG (UPF0249 family)